MNRYHIWLSLIVLLGLLLFIKPIQFRADIFSLLPQNSDTVVALKQYQQTFASSESIVVLVENDSPEKLLSDIEVVVDVLVQDQLIKYGVWKNPLLEDENALAEITAFMWLNQQDETIEAFLHRFDNDNVDHYLENTLEQLTTSFNPEQIAKLANDPFGLLDVFKSQPQRDSQFASEDGRSRALYLPYPSDKGSYWLYQDWLQKIQDKLSALENDKRIDSSIQMTGNPVFIVEFGSKLIKDLSAAAAGTILFVLLLFWWAHRHWQPLFWLALGLFVTLGYAMFLGSVIFGSLNAVSLGFAAILMGLAVDYALIVYQERQVTKKKKNVEIRKIVAPSILWAAATTAFAFLMLTRSSLPGVVELGALVAMGILIASVVVLYCFLPVLYVKNNTKSYTFFSNLENRNYGYLSFFLLISCILVVSINPPRLETDVKKLQFKDNSARNTFDKLQAKILGDSSEIWLVVEGSYESIYASLNTINQTHESLINNSGLRLNLNSPFVFWPNTTAQYKNITKLADLANKKEEIKEKLIQKGFTESSFVLADNILNIWNSLSLTDKTQRDVILPSSPPAKWLFSQFKSDINGKVIALAKISSRDPLDVQSTQKIAQAYNSIPGVSVGSWLLLASEISGTMVHDAIYVFLPMLFVLLFFLGLVFKNIGDVILSFLTLGFSFLMLAALMSLLGWRWNIINLTALPLLLGAGVDYSIHIQLALRRHQGNLSSVNKSVGFAILLCGTSTAIAFASLGFTSNIGIASLGKVVSLGIVVTAFTAVVLLPWWWRKLHRNSI